MLELAILGLLEDQAMHGYEIRKRLRDELGQVSNVSFGSLYPALSRLERSGAVQATEDSGAGSPSPVPMTGSLSGERAALRARRSGSTLGRRGRKVYRITDAGRRQFAELLDTERTGGTEDARSFGLRLAFARYLPPTPGSGCSSAAGRTWCSAWPRPGRRPLPPRVGSTPTHDRSWSTPPRQPNATSPGSTASSRPSGTGAPGRGHRRCRPRRRHSR